MGLTLWWALFCYGGDSMTGKGTLITTATTTQVFLGAGVLKRIVVGETATGTIKVYDAITGTTSQVVELNASIVEGTYEFDIHLKTGCRVITAGASKIVVVTA